MRRREFLGTVAAAITTRMQGPTVPKTTRPKTQAADVEFWMDKCRQLDERLRPGPPFFFSWKTHPMIDGEIYQYVNAEGVQ